MKQVNAATAPSQCQYLMEEYDCACPSKVQIGTDITNAQGLTLKDVLCKLSKTCHMTTINTNSGYHNLNLNFKHPHILPHLHANLAGTSSPDYPLGQDQQVTCSR